MLDARDVNIDVHTTKMNQPLVRLGPVALSLGDVVVALLLAGAIFLGAYFRFTGNNWDDFVRFHPDERYLTGQIAPQLGGPLAICGDASPACQEYMARVDACMADYPETQGRGPYFDADCSPFNPENIALTQYVYGTLPLFMARISADFVAEQTNNLTWISYSGLFQVWRALSALADSIVILLVFLIGLRLHNKWIGVTAALLYAAAVFPIQQAHFGTTDAITNLFATLSIYFLVRVQDTNGFFDYAGFGLVVGAAVASRINVAPLAFVLAVPVLLHMLPGFDRRVPWSQRNALLARPLLGGVLAAVLAFIAFRIGNPYAFQGPGFFGLALNERFLDALSQAQFSVSGEMDWAPNWQWVNRTGFLFPLQNMVLWGMGIALGLTGWIAFGWALWRLVRGKVDATRNIVLVTWVLGYFLFVGSLWVMSMRYYLPLYPPLAVLAAWLLFGLLRGAWQRRGLTARASVLALFGGVMGFTLLWALMFTNIYRSQATFVQSGHYTWERIPGDFSMQIEGAPPETPLVNIALRNSLVDPLVPPPSIDEELLFTATRVEPGTAARYDFVAPADGTVSEVRAFRMAAVNVVRAADPQTGRQVIQDITYDIGPRTVEVAVLPRLDPFAVVDLDTLPQDQILARATYSGPLPAETHLLGEGYTLTFDQPLQLAFAQEYTFIVQVTGGTVLTSGAIMASEQPWDEAVPPNVCTLPPGVTLADDPPPGLLSAQDCNGRTPWEGLVQIFNLDLAGEDTPEKRERLLAIIDQTDYLVVNTNRRYDSQSRIPLRWPMTNAYYDALFGGELGFELERMFQETFELGPLKISDQYLPIYDAPAWLNEFEPEEAFTVYDHPVVFFYRKSDDYSDLDARLALDVPLGRAETVGGYNDPTIAPVLPISSLEADPAPTHLMFTDTMEQTQEQGGTWSARFDSDSPVNTNEVLAVVVWWLATSTFGLAAWPLLFVAFPALADRGYAFARIVGLLLVSWGVWVLGTMRLHVWHQAGVALGLLILAALSGLIVWRQRDRLIGYLRARWKLLLAIEVLALAMYVVFVLVRLTNPDLWHFAYGGEKPMDFAYFNGILRSTIFPPIDPWFAGGYINYYYFGFVLVAAPTLLTGIVPGVAYNLILPMLFALVGIGAFGAAFDLVSSWHTAERDDAGTVAEAPRRRPLGSPWLAGIAALLLVAVLGNLDTARVFVTGVAGMGGYEQPTGLVDYYRDQLAEEFVEETGAPPDEVTAMIVTDEATARAENAGLFDRLRYEIHNTTALIGGFFGGLGDLLSGQPLNVSADRWFWGPTRVIAEIPPPDDGAINEMPIFTFIYGDMHAHMISMPLMLFVMAFIFHEVMIAGRERRGFWPQALAIGLGGLVVGMFQAVNTWDYPTFLILGVLGLGYAWWLNWRRITRWSLVNMVLRIGGFIVIGTAAALPFTLWFASGLTDFKIWEGQKTPLWAYFQIHGFFLFLIVSLLIWETARWLAAVRLRDVRGRLWLLQGIGLLMLGAFILGLVGALLDYQVALIVLPLLAWIAVLFFRPGQSRALQYALVLAGLGLAITLGTEIITLANDNGRQNTIFKFYIQVWLLFGVVGGAGFAWVVRSSTAWRPRLALPWYTIFSLMLFVAALFPIMAVRGKEVFRFSHQVPTTLDGLAYMNYAVHVEDGVSGPVELRHDYNVIRWLQENVEGSPVIMEALSGRLLYQWGARIANNTGLPTVIGWDYHQRQQRSLYPLDQLVNQRVANVNAFYNTDSISAAVDILRYYDVRYVIVSDYEQKRYGITDEERAAGFTSGLDKFPQMVERGLLRIAYQEEVATVYEVVPAQLEAYVASRIASGTDEETAQIGAE